MINMFIKTIKISRYLLKMSTLKIVLLEYLEFVIKTVDTVAVCYSWSGLQMKDFQTNLKTE